MRRNSLKIMLVAFAAVASPVAGQVTHSRATAATHVTAARTPYTAEYKATSTRPLADGNTITHEHTEVVAVDSQGRRMTQITTTRAKDQVAIVSTNVFDPIARTDTRWSSLNKKATVMMMGAGHGCATESRPNAPSAPRSRPTIERENLGTASIQGVEARGTRTTSTIAAGEVGNDTPLVTTTEKWTAVAVGLKGLMVREITDDARSGKYAKELTSISQEEPDPALFRPPADYEIVTKDASSAGCPAESAPDNKKDDGATAEQ